MNWQQRLLVTLLWLLPLCGQAQQSTLRCKNLPARQSLLLDASTVAPGTITITDSTAGYDYDPGSGEITIHSPADSVRVCYRVFPNSLFVPVQQRQRTEFDSLALFRHGQPVVQHPALQAPATLLRTPGIQKTGTLSRGISVGNQQSAFVNSQLNLQLYGQLTDDISIEALITDQQIPYQPEGNTQRLDDFDQVYIRLKHEQGALTMGDLVLQNQESHFLRYFKNGQGAQLETAFETDKGSISSRVAISGAQGKFYTEQVTPLDGVSGPYQLRGPAEEQFVIILANSEKVYVDGQLLNRGFDQDYVIDYNTAEVTFTPKVLITAYSRIRVDFEFATREFARTITLADHQQQQGALKWFVNFYQERDQPNTPLQYELNDSDRERLAGIGDQTEQAFISGVDSVAYSPDRILYARRDTLVNGAVFQAFVRSANPDEAWYAIRFTELGPGLGDYVLLQNTANGRVYQWVAPIAGEPQGDHAPVIGIRTPDSRQMLTTGLQLALGAHETAFAEWALSNRDLNLYSPTGDEDNQGMAWRAGLRSAKRQLKWLPGYVLDAQVDLERDDAHFQPIDRFRSIEFDRNWGFDPAAEAEQQQDQIIQASLGLQKDAHNQLSYQLADRRRGSSLSGTQHHLQVAKALGSFRWKGQYFHLDNESNQGISRWRRWQAELSWQGGAWMPGYRYTEDRHQLSTAPGKVQSTANNYAEHEVYLQRKDSLQGYFFLSQSLRRDRLPVEGNLQDATTAWSTRLQWATPAGRQQQLQLNATYRHLQNLLTDSSTTVPEQSLSSQLNWQGAWWQRHITSSLRYGITNSRELRRDFVFVPVDPGQGTHTWRDENNDGIQDLNEFYEALNPDERLYAKLFVPTSEYLLAFRNELNLRVDVRFPKAWAGQGFLSNLLSRLSLLGLVQTDQKHTATDWEQRLLPWAETGEEALATRRLLRSSVFYNRNSRHWSAELSRQGARRRQLLSNGFELSDEQSWQLSNRLGLGAQWQASLQLLSMQKTSQSDFIAGRNYQIEREELIPEISWQPNARLRLSLSRRDSWRQLQEEEGDALPAHYASWSVESQWARSGKGNLRFRFSQININYEGPENNQASYELLEGLRPGQNQTWILSWQQSLSNGLRLNLQYDGRRSAQNQAIHTGRVSVLAIF